MEFSNIYKDKRVLITGHTGFKGSWLAIWLKNLGADVYGYALAPTSDLDNFNRCDLENKIHHTIGDIRDGKKLSNFFAEVQPDIAFHLAAQPLVLLSYDNPFETFEINLMGAVNFFEAVRKTASVKVAINITSDKCYDNQEWIWGYRENDPMGGKDPYSASKGCSELITNSYLHSFFNQSSCSIASVRAGNVIGGGDWAADRIVPDYFRALANKQSLSIRNPNATRPWQHVLEPLSGYLNLGAAMYAGGKSYSGGWNFGPEDTTNYSVKQLIDKMLAVDATIAINCTLSEQTAKPHEANLLKLDISKAVNKLNWHPVLSFDETVEFTVNGYQDDLNGENIFIKRIEQIERYTEKATVKRISWAL